jgi:hypothetical protein
MAASFLRRVDRLAGRFSRWLAPAAVASGTRNTDMPGTVDPLHVAAGIELIRHSGPDAAEPQEDPRDPI